MSDEVKRRAFDPLFTTRGRGTQKGQGLGLAMVYNIITRYHNGFIDIETTEEKGTISHVYLPKAETDVSTLPKDVPKVEEGTETVLVIEDEESIRKMTVKCLKTHGYKLLTVADELEGLGVYTANRDIVDLVLVDLTMPVMSGEKFLESIMEINPDVKVVITSGHGEEEMQKYTYAKDYIPKPYSITELARTVRSVLDM